MAAGQERQVSLLKSHTPDYAVLALDLHAMANFVCPARKDKLFPSLQLTVGDA